MNRQYIGARYVPKLDGEWNKNVNYEPLTIVTHLGASYTSKIPVPKGIDITDDKYWVLTGNYNAQVEEYRQNTNALKDNVNKRGILVDSIGILTSNTGSENSRLFNEYALSHKDVPVTFLFSAGTYNFSDPLTIYPHHDLIGSNSDTKLVFDDSTTNGCIILPSDITDGSYAYNYNGGAFKNLNVRGVKTRDCFVFGDKITTSLINIPILLFENIKISNFKTGLYIEGYGHTLINVQTNGCTIGIDIVHPEQVSLFDCWSLYNDIGLQVNVSKKGVYGSTFNIIGGAVQRNRVGAVIRECRNVNINTYCEQNTEEDFIFGDKNNTSYNTGVIGVNMNYFFESSNRKDSYYSIYLASTQSVNINAITAVKSRLVESDGNSKYIYIKINEVGCDNNFTGTSIQSNSVTVGKTTTEKINYSDNLKTRELYRYQNSNYVNVGSVIEACNYINNHNAFYKKLINAFYGYDINNNGFFINNGTDNILTVTKDSLMITKKIDGKNGIKINNACDIQYDSDTKRLKAYYNGAWHNISVD